MRYMERCLRIAERKVWKCGSSHVITLPAEWVDEGWIEEGQKYLIELCEDGRVILTPAMTVPKEECYASR